MLKIRRLALNCGGIGIGSGDRCICRKSKIQPFKTTIQVKSKVEVTCWKKWLVNPEDLNQKEYIRTRGRNFPITF